MKKFFPYILIPIVLVGILVPFAKTFAAPSCYIVDSAGKVTIHPTEKTEGACRGISSSRFPWQWGEAPRGTGAALPSSISNPSNLPECILDDGDNVTNSPCSMNGTMVTVNSTTGAVSSIPTTAPKPPEQKELDCTIMGGFWTCINSMLARLAYLIMSIAAFILWLAGTILNFVLKFTILDMAENLKSMTGINIAWKITRDLMNIAFIFLLVYQGIKIIIGLEDVGKVKTFVFGVILASLLINFSLFFTKVMIDASNIVTIGIYNTIIDTSKNPQAIVAGPQGGTEDVYRSVSGLSVPFMNALGLTNFYSSASFADISANVGGGTNMLIFFLMGTVIFVIVSFIFFAVAAMFVIRYVTLLILLMLSPLAYMGLALPQMDSYAKKWWASLNGQLIFAPVYMIMTLIILTLMQSPNFLSKGDWGAMTSVGEGGSINLIFNFVVVIGLILGSLVAAKQTASQGSSYIGQATGSLTKFAGNSLMGSSAYLMRRSIGGMASQTSVEDLEARVAKGGAGGVAARMQLAASRGSFDIRRSKVGEAGAKATGVDLGKGMPFKPTAGEGGRAAVNAETKKKGTFFSNLTENATGMGTMGEENLDKILKSYVDKRNWDGLSDYMKKASEKDAQYMYKKMNARDRVSLDGAINDRSYTSKLREKLPIDDQIKVFTDAKDWEGLANFIQTKDGKPRTEQDQADIYRNVSDKDRVALEKTSWGISPKGKAIIATMKSSLPFDEQVKVYRINKAWGDLATFMRTGKTDEQKRYIYESLPVRDRVEFETKGGLSTTEIADLRKGLSAEEQDKTIKEAKEAKKRFDNERKLDDVEAITAGRAPSNPALTLDDLIGPIGGNGGKLPVDAAKDLDSESRKNPEVIQRLSKQHLRSLMKSGTLTQEEIDKIVDVVTNTTYPSQKDHIKFMNQPDQKDFWMP